MDLFFRADDIGWDYERFERLAGLFVSHGLKLNAAAIPLVVLQSRAKLDLDRFEGFLEMHGHGLAHLDYESSGKKSEFGDSRSDDDVRHDLERSYEAMRRLFGTLFFPAFVPPWNRLADRFLPRLPEAGYVMLSRDGRERAQTAGLVERNVGVDLHTSRKPPPPTPEALWDEVQRLEAAGAPAVGVMLHHARMDEAAFSFLEGFMRLLNERGTSSVFLSEAARA